MTAFRSKQYSLGCPTEDAPRRASVMVEFLLVASIMYILLAVVMELGRAIFIAQSLGQAASLFARELARTPLPPTIGFAEALDHPIVRDQLFDERLLVIDLDRLTSLDQNLDDYFAELPLINQQLRTLMIFDQIRVGGQTRSLLRYPGAIVSPETIQEPVLPTPRGGLDSGLRIRIPIVRFRSDGTESIAPMSAWLPIVQEIGADPQGNDLFPIQSRWRGVVAVQMNYPFQAAAFTANYLDPHRPPTHLQEPSRLPIQVSPDDRLRPGERSHPYGGKYGLGRQASHGTTVRPFRQLLHLRGFHRRELFE